MATSEDGEGQAGNHDEAWIDALAELLGGADGEGTGEGAAPEIDDLRRTVEVAGRILAMREAGERHATVEASRSVPLGSAIQELASSLDTLGLSVVEAGKSLGIVAETSATLVTRVPAQRELGGSESAAEFETLCRAQSGALTSILTAMQGNAELAKQARVQLSVVARAAAQTEQRLRLARAAEAAVVDSIEQVLAALRRLAGATGSKR